MRVDQFIGILLFLFLLLFLLCSWWENILNERYFDEDTGKLVGVGILLMIVLGLVGVGLWFGEPH